MAARKTGFQLSLILFLLPFGLPILNPDSLLGYG